MESQSFPFSLSVLDCASQYVSWSHTALGAFLLVKERSYPGLRSVSKQQKEKNRRGAHGNRTVTQLSPEDRALVALVGEPQNAIKELNHLWHGLSPSFGT